MPICMLEECVKWKRKDLCEWLRTMEWENYLLAELLLCIYENMVSRETRVCLLISRRLDSVM